MRYLVLACRSLFKKGQHNVLKIVSLAVGLAVGLLLLAKVFFLRSYDTFYPGCENIYRVRMDYSVGEENGESFTTSGAVAPGMAAEIPGVETYARLVGYYPEYGTVMDLKGKTSIASFMVVASGTSQRHVASLAEKVQENLKAAGYKSVSEGAEKADWVLIDAFDVIVHIFKPEVREFYNIEKMWSAVAEIRK